jgi:hypothetical protein
VRPVGKTVGVRVGDAVAVGVLAVGVSVSAVGDVVPVGVSVAVAVMSVGVPV